MEAVEQITAAVTDLASAVNRSGASRTDRFDATLRVMGLVGRLRSLLEAVQIDTLNEMLDLADTQLPDGARPGAVRHHESDTDSAGAVNSTDGGDRWMQRAEIASVELGFELGMSPHAAMSMLHDATRATRAFGDSVALLRSARLRPAQYRALTTLTAGLDDQDATRVQQSVLRRGSDCSNAQWRDRLRRAIRRTVGTDDLAKQRRKRAEDRYLRFGEAGLDGMSPVTGLMPALDAAEADAALTWAAGTASPGDERTVDQRRVDALLTILRGPCSFTRPDAQEPGAPRLDEDLMPVDVDPGEAGEAASVWDQIRQLAARVNLTIPRIPERLIDITVPAQILAGADLHVGDATGEDRSASSGTGRDGHIPPRDGPDSSPAGLLPEARIGTLGVIDAQLARRLAHDARWRRILTDPRTGAPVDIGTKTYRPPAAMRRRVLKRDRTCRAPGCNRKARLDLDHIDPHRADGTGGATSDANLQGLCRRHHLAKHQLRWQVHGNPDGSITWRRGHRKHTTWPDSTEDP